MESILFMILGLLLLVLIGRLLLIPMRVVFKLLGNGILGYITLIFFNLIGGIFGLTIQVTPLNSLISGFFGVPGVLVILILQNFF